MKELPPMEIISSEMVERDGRPYIRSVRKIDFGKAGIATVAGSAFGTQGEGYIRLSYACSYEDLQEAIRRIKDAVEKLKK